jgi:hypothetical protein
MVVVLSLAPYACAGSTSTIVHFPNHRGRKIHERSSLPGLLVPFIGGSVALPLLLLTILFQGSRRPLPNAGALALVRGLLGA